MIQAAGRLEELYLIRNDVMRALGEIWRGARLVRDGVDVTESQKVHLQAVILQIDAIIGASKTEAGQPQGTLREFEESRAVTLAARV